MASRLGVFRKLSGDLAGTVPAFGGRARPEAELDFPSLLAGRQAGEI